MATIAASNMPSRQSSKHAEDSFKSDDDMRTHRSEVTKSNGSVEQVVRNVMLEEMTMTR